MAENECFYVANEEVFATIPVVDGKIDFVTWMQYGIKRTIYPIEDVYDSYINSIFEMMMSKPERFKRLLLKIKFLEPEYYKKGAEMLENKRNSLLKEAEKYVL